MDFLLLLFPVLLIPKMKIAPRGTYFDSLSKENSQILKGICAVVIVFAHMSSNAMNIAKPDMIFKNLMFIGVYAVSVFFLFSGYGLSISYIKKGNAYLSGFFKNRFISLLVPFFIMLVLYNAELICEGKFSWDYFFFSVIDGSPLNVRYSWYVAVITLFYILFYFAARFAKDSKPKLIAAVVCALCVYIALCYAFSIPSHYFSSVIAFLFGVIIACFKEKAETAVRNRWSLFAAVSVILLAASLVFRAVKGGMLSNAVVKQIASISTIYLNEIFLISVILIFMQKLSFNNAALRFLGSISYELYLTHGLVIVLLKKTALVENCWIFAFSVLLLSAVSAYLLHLLSTAVIKRLRGVKA